MHRDFFFVTLMISVLHAWLWYSAGQHGLDIVDGCVWACSVLAGGDLGFNQDIISRRGGWDGYVSK
jgi:hypothetical protein